MLTIDELQRQQYVWARKNFGPCKSRWPLMGVFEETGELIHSSLKQEQGIRGSFDEHEAKKKDAIADISIYLFEYCSCMGWEITDLLVEEETTLHQLQEHTDHSGPVWDCLGKIVPLAYNVDASGDNVLSQEDAVQLLLNLAIYCRQRGWSLQELVETTWLRVSQRDWTKNKKDGGDTIDEDDKKLRTYLDFIQSDKGREALHRAVGAEIEKWRADPNYIPILPSAAASHIATKTLLVAGGEPIHQKGEIFLLHSEDPHAPSALYGYSESLRYGYDLIGVKGDDKRADEIWAMADRWGDKQIPASIRPLEERIQQTTQNLVEERLKTIDPRDRTNRTHWEKSIGAVQRYIEDPHDRTNYLLNEHDRLSGRLDL